MENKKRLIYADALEKHIADTFGYPAADILHEIATFPTVDAVPVVRCKDCRRFVENRKAFVTYCSKGCGMAYVKPDDFCSHGESRTDGAKMDLEVE